MHIVSDRTCLTELDGKRRFKFTIELELIGLELGINLIPGVVQSAIAILLGAIRVTKKFKARS